MVFYDKPFLKFERLMETYVALAPRGFNLFKMAIPLWLRETLFQKSLLRRELRNSRKASTEQTSCCSASIISHAASAFYPSPFENAVVLTMDGVGEWATTSAGLGDGQHLEIFKDPFSSLPRLTLFGTDLLHRVQGELRRIQGDGAGALRPAKIRDLILDNLIDVKADGSFRLNMSYFDYCTGLRMINNRFIKLFGAPVRGPESC